MRPACFPRNVFLSGVSWFAFSCFWCDSWAKTSGRLRALVGFPPHGFEAFMDWLQTDFQSMNRLESLGEKIGMPDGACRNSGNTAGSLGAVHDLRHELVERAHRIQGARGAAEHAEKEGFSRAAAAPREPLPEASGFNRHRQPVSLARGNSLVAQETSPGLGTQGAVEAGRTGVFASQS